MPKRKYVGRIRITGIEMNHVQLIKFYFVTGCQEIVILVDF